MGYEVTVDRGRRPADRGGRRDDDLAGVPGAVAAVCSTRCGAACARPGISRGCRNVMLYRDDVPNVEVGVALDQPCPLTGRVTTSALPAGQVAMTVHRGSYAALGAAHQAVADWCAAHGRRPAGPRWEVYGPHHDDPAEVWTEVYHLLS